MPRQPRPLKPDSCYHITVRCISDCISGILAIECSTTFDIDFFLDTEAKSTLAVLDPKLVDRPIGPPLTPIVLSLLQLAPYSGEAGNNAS